MAITQLEAGMPILIDAYNLMHAVGLAPPPGYPIASYRQRFLDWLTDSLTKTQNRESVTLVFDAQNSMYDLGSQVYKNVTITHSFRETADDLIEVMIAMELQPSKLFVVSSDRRLRDAARSRGCLVKTSDEYLDDLMRGTQVPRTSGVNIPTPDNDKPTPGDDIEELFRAFQQPKKKK